MKGQYDGVCYRTSCSNTHAVFYNYSTRQYYCGTCAELINAANKMEALEMYGHDLCLKDSQRPVEEPVNTQS